MGPPSVDNWTEDLLSPKGTTWHLADHTRIRNCRPSLTVMIGFQQSSFHDNYASVYDSWRTAGKTVYIYQSTSLCLLPGSSQQLSLTLSNARMFIPSCGHLSHSDANADGDTDAYADSVPHIHSKPKRDLILYSREDSNLLP